MTRFISLSHFDVDDLEPAMAALKSEPLACNQVLYHLGDRAIEGKLIPFCRKHRIAVMGYSPSGHRGFSAGRRLAALVQRIGRTPRQIALNFLTRYGVHAIPQSGNPEHVRENAGALGWRLTDEATVEVNRLFPEPDHDVPLGMICSLTGVDEVVFVHFAVRRSDFAMQCQR